MRIALGFLAVWPPVVGCDEMAARVVQDAAVPQDSEAWMRLIADPYTLGPGEEISGSETRILERNLLIAGIRPHAPAGTHHMVLSVPGKDHLDQLFVSVLGTETLRFPAGVGFSLPAGTPARLDVHYFNPTDAAVADEAAVEILEQPAKDGPLMIADQIYPAVLDGEIPPGTITTLTGHCTVSWPSRLFALLPHMHWLGQHMVVTLRRASDGGRPIQGESEVVLYDDDVDPLHQTYLEISEVDVAVGDVLTVSCIYENTTDTTVHIAGSSSDEMCVAMIYRYPGSPDQDLYCTE